jgi:hypothetical protein
MEWMMSGWRRGDSRWERTRPAGALPQAHRSEADERIIAQVHPKTHGKKLDWAARLESPA